MDDKEENKKTKEELGIEIKKKAEEKSGGEGCFKIRKKCQEEDKEQGQIDEETEIGVEAGQKTDLESDDEDDSDENGDEFKHGFNFEEG